MSLSYLYLGIHGEHAQLVNGQVGRTVAWHGVCDALSNYMHQLRATLHGIIIHNIIMWIRISIEGNNSRTMITKLDKIQTCGSPPNEVPCRKVARQVFVSPAKNAAWRRANSGWIAAEIN